MVDIAHVDILTAIPNNWKRKNANEYAGACPFCGGKDRFCVWIDTRRYWCRKCNEQGDVLTYEQKINGLTFVEACQKHNVTLENDTRNRTSQPTQRPPATVPAPPPVNRPNTEHATASHDPHWQTMAWKFVSRARQVLWETEQGKTALEYLHQRGFTNQTLAEANIGYCPIQYNQQWGNVEVHLPAGIVIPWIYPNHELHRVTVRRDGWTADSELSKYPQAKGGRNTLYQGWRIWAGCTVIMVEGEFDCLSLRQEFASPYSAFIPVAAGSTSAARLVKWIAKLATAEHVLLAFDNEEAGDKASQYWLETLPNARRLRPTLKDVNDMLKAGEDIISWVETALLTK